MHLVMMTLMDTCELTVITEIEQIRLIRQHRVPRLASVLSAHRSSPDYSH